MNAQNYFIPRKVKLPSTTKRIEKSLLTSSITQLASPTLDVKNIKDYNPPYSDYHVSNYDDNGDDTYITVEVPVHIISVRCGNNFTIAIDNNGDMYSWGWNESGCLGQGMIHDSAMIIVILVVILLFCDPSDLILYIYSTIYLCLLIYLY